MSQSGDADSGTPTSVRRRGKGAVHIAPRVALLVLLLAAVLLLIGEFIIMPSQVSRTVLELFPAPARLPGRFAALSFVTTVLIAPWIHRYKIEPARHLLVPLAVVSGAITIVRWPAVFPGTPLCVVIQALAVVGLSWILAKLLLLQRFSAGTARYFSAESYEGPLLCRCFCECLGAAE